MAVYLLTNRSASSQDAPVIRAKMASSQSCGNKGKSGIQTLASNCRQEVLHCWMIFSCIRISQVGHCCRRAYFSILVQQQSSF